MVNFMFISIIGQSWSDTVDGDVKSSMDLTSFLSPAHVGLQTFGQEVTRRGWQLQENSNL